MCWAGSFIGGPPVCFGLPLQPMQSKAAAASYPNATRPQAASSCCRCCCSLLPPLRRRSRSLLSLPPFSSLCCRSYSFLAANFYMINLLLLAIRRQGHHSKSPVA